MGITFYATKTKKIKEGQKMLTNHSKSNDWRATLKALLPETSDRVMVTNIDRADKNPQEKFCLIVQKHQLTYVQRKENAKQVMGLNLTTKQVTFNGALKDKSWMRVFLMKFEQVLRALKEGRAEIYHAKTKEVSYEV